MKRFITKQKSTVFFLFTLLILFGASHTGYGQAIDRPLEDANGAPVFSEGESTTRSVAENTPAGTNIGAAISATDPNNGDTLTYSLHRDDSDAFQIDPNTGQLKTKAALDYETKNAYNSLAVRVTDSSGLTDAILVTISVTNVNEAPVFSEGARATRSVAEDTAAGTNIGTVFTATDPDSGDTLTYSLHRDNSDAFQIDPNTGQLKTKAPLDYETKNAYTDLAVRVTDSSGLTDAILVTINVTDVNENRAPVFTDGDSTTRAIAENTASGQNIGSVVAATDADTGDTLTYILEGRDANAFRIVKTSGQLQTNAALDYETKSSYSVILFVSDSKGGSDSIDVTITVRNVNEAPTFTEGATATRTVVENTASGENIGDPVAAADVDAGDTLSYTLAGTDASSFSIVATSGQLQTKAALDYETKSSYAVTVSVSDSKGETDSIDVKISVTASENRAPVFTDGTDTTRSIAENTAAGQNIGAAVTATDADNDTLTYILEGIDANAFHIVKTSGQIETKAALDYETKGVYSVMVSALDGNGGIAHIEVRIDVTDVNENRAPVFTDGASTTRAIAENTASGENIGSVVAATDTNTGDTLTYTLSGTNAADFSIVSTTGQLQTSTALDFETKTSYSVTISVSDDNGGSDAIDVTIDVTNVNEAPVFSEGARATRSVTENTVAGTNIGAAISATDPDSGDTLTYSLRRDDRDAFEIDPNTGQLQTRAALDYETKNAYTDLAVRVTDSSGLTDAILVTITVTDVEEITPLNQRTQQVRDAILAAVGVANPAAVTRAHLAGIAELDLSNKGIRSLRSGDFDGLTTLTKLELKGNAITDIVPLAEVITARWLNLSGNSISDISALKHATALTYLNLSNNLISDISAIAGLTTLEVLHLGGNSISDISALKDLTTLEGLYLDSNSISNISALDDLTALTELELSRNSISDISALDDLTALEWLFLYTNSISDISALKDLTALESLSLSSNPISDISALASLTALIRLELSDGSVKDVSALENLTTLERLYLGGNPIADYDPLRRLIAAIALIESHPGFRLDINIPPAFTDGTSITRSVAENTAANTNIGAAISATDADHDILNYYLGGTDADSFNMVLSSGSGQLQTSADLDYETKSSYSVTITVSDNNGGTDTIDVTITVTDVNEAPSFANSTATRSVAENTASGENIGDPVVATDEDADTTLVYTLGGTDASSFSIDGTTGQLQTNAALDYETQSTYSVSITASDGSLTGTINVTIDVTDVAENSAPVFTDGDSTTRTVAENTVSGENIGDPVAATDVDTEDILTYTLGGTDAASFSIVSTSGQLQTRTALDYETKPSYSVTVSVDDGNNGTDNIDVTIDVSNVNEAPNFTDGGSTTRTVAENTAAGENIGDPVAATDVDSEDTLTYTLAGTDAASFSIVSTSGQLQTNAALNYETTTSYSVTVSVDDGNNGTDSIDVTITVTDVYEPIIHRTQQVQEAIVSALITAGVTGVNSPDDVTEAHLAVITELQLSFASITSLQSGDFSGLTALTDLNLESNSITDISALTGLTTLTDLDLSDNSISDISALDGLTALTDLDLARNSITDVSDLEGLTALETLYLSGNSISDYEPLRRLIAAIALIEDHPGLDLDINIPPVFTDGDSTTRSVSENMPSETNIGAVISATDADNDTLIYSLGGTDAASFSINSESGQLQTTSVLDYETKTSYSVTVSVDDGNNGTDIITVTIDVTDVDETSITAVNQRTQQVRDAIVAAVSGVNSADAVTPAHLVEITRLILPRKGITSLKSGDFSGLTALEYLDLADNSISDISALTGLTALTTLYLENNSISDISALDDLTALTTLYLSYNSISDISALDDLTALEYLDLAGNSISDVSDLEDLTALRNLFLSGNPISDYEPLRTLKTAIEGAGNSISIDIDITNNPPVFADGNSTTRSVSENMPPNTNIGTAISATDTDGDTLTYSLGGTDADAFDIVSTSGQLKTASVLDYETKSSYSVTVSVSDDNDGKGAISVTIDVTDVDETAITAVNQRTQQVQDAIVAEVSGVNSADDVTHAHLAVITSLDLSGESITSLKAGDFSGLTALTWLYMGSNSISDISALNDLTALTDLNLGDNSISDISALDDLTALTHLYLTDNSITDISALDDLTALIDLTLGGNSISNISALDDLTALTQLDLDDNSITDISALEDLTALTYLSLSNNSVSDISALDDLTALTKLYLTDNSISDVSDLEGLTALRNLYLRGNPISDYTPLRTLKAAIEKAGNSISIDLDMSNNPPVFTDGDSTTRSVSENKVSGTNIGTAVSATDKDNDTLTYSLSGTDADSFSINDESGQLQTTSVLDYETKSSYSVTVSVYDGVDATDTITVTITVIDVDETSIVAVNQRTQQVQDVIVAAVPGVDNADDVTNAHLAVITQLSLSGQGITSLQSGDFSGLTALTWLNLGGNSISDISALDDLTALTTLYLANNSISDISALAGLTTLTDLDLDSNSITDISTLEDLTALIWLDLDGNSISNVSALEDLTALETLYLGGNPIVDYEPLRTLKTAIENAGNSISIDIDINNNPPVFTDGDSTTRSVSENKVSGTNIGTAVSATDEDNDTLTYSLGGTDAASFSINDDSGQLQTTSVLDYETKSSYSVTVSVSDGNDGLDIIPVTIDITDVDETSITAVNQRTQQVQDAIVEEVNGVNNADDVTHAHLAVITQLTLSSKGITSLKASDFSGLTALEYLYLSDNSISDISALEDLTTLTNLDLGYNSITDISALDDLTALEHLALGHNSISDVAALEGLTALISLHLRGNPISDYEPLRTLKTAIETAGNSISIDIDINNNPPVFADGNSTTRSVSENKVSGTNIGAAISATDTDAGTTLTYSLGGTDAASFSIVKTSGQLQTTSVLDYETKSSYSVTVSVSDGNDGIDIITVTIDITDVDETSITAVNQRTPAVQDAIVAEVFGVNNADDVTHAHLAVITQLTLSSQGITSLQSGDFSGLTGLTILNLSNNSITDIPSLDGLTALIDLNLSYNSISDISPLDDLTALEQLYLGGNSISDISPLEDLTALTWLTLSNNSITDVSDLEGLTALGHLFLKGNPIADYEPLRTLKTAIENAGNSISIDIDINNNLPVFTNGNSTERSVSENMPSETNIGTAVSATDTDTADILTYSLGGTDAASFSIDKRSGQLQTTSVLDYETKSSYSVTVSVSDGNDGTDSITVTISVTDVDESSIIAVNQRTQQVQDAIVEEVSGVDNADDVTHAHLAAITRLILSSESITSLKTGDFSGLTALTILYLDDNSISDISTLADLTALEHLDLDDNSISDISVLADLTTLKYLYLSDNSITDISALDELTALETLHLLNNSITDVSDLEGLTALDTLYLGGNPISDYTPLQTLKTAIEDAENSIYIDIDMTNNPPVFTDGSSTTRSVAENTEAAQNIGAAVGATDADNDTLTYSLGGTDAASFDIVSTSGQLQTKAALDYETKTSYTVTVTAYDGNSGGDRITVTIDVTDVVENAPAAPSVETSALIPEKTDLLTNFPNPFNPETWIPYQLAKPADVTLTIYDVRGLVVRELKLGHQAAGFYQSRSAAIYWDGRNAFGEKVASGLYFYTLKAGDFTATRKLLIRK